MTFAMGPFGKTLAYVQARDARLFSFPFSAGDNPCDRGATLLNSEVASWNSNGKLDIWRFGHPASVVGLRNPIFFSAVHRLPAQLPQRLIMLYARRVAANRPRCRTDPKVACPPRREQKSELVGKNRRLGAGDVASGGMWSSSRFQPPKRQVVE